MSLVELTAKALDTEDSRQAVRAVAELRRRLEAVETDNVARAVEDGWSWARIAEDLGISKQGAYRRHGKRVKQLGGARRRRGTRADRLLADRVVITAPARRTVRAARVATLALEHAQLETAHLLLGVLSAADGPPAKALADVGIDFDRASRAVSQLDIPRLAPATSRRGRDHDAQVTLSPDARAALEHSIQEAKRLGHEHLRVEHVLLAILADDGDTAVRVVRSLGATPADMERCLGKVLREADFRSDA